MRAARPAEDSANLRVMRFADHNQRNARLARRARHFMNARYERTCRVNHRKSPRVQRLHHLAAHAVRTDDCARAGRNLLHALDRANAQRFQAGNDLRVVNDRTQCDRGRSLFGRLHRAANAEAKARVRRQYHSDLDPPL